jgi:hypothetical protein
MLIRNLGSRYISTKQQSSCLKRSQQNKNKKKKNNNNWLQNFPQNNNYLSKIHPGLYPQFIAFVSKQAQNG